MIRPNAQICVNTGGIITNGFKARTLNIFESGFRICLLIHNMIHIIDHGYDIIILIMDYFMIVQSGEFSFSSMWTITFPIFSIEILTMRHRQISIQQLFNIM